MSGESGHKWPHLVKWMHGLRGWSGLLQLGPVEVAARLIEHLSQLIRVHPYRQTTVKSELLRQVACACTALRDLEGAVADARQSPKGEASFVLTAELGAAKVRLEAVRMTHCMELHAKLFEERAFETKVRNMQGL